MSKVVVLGAGGMLAQSFAKTAPLAELTLLTRAQCDITSMDSLAEHTEGADWIINLSAYTRVDDAESHEEDALRVNAGGVRNIALAAQRVSARVLHVSTDYVFDGKASSPYNEDEEGNPQTVYGRSKWQGELYLRALLPKSSVVMRTAWLYGHPGASFVHSILKAGAEREFLDVVEDQIGQPTWTSDVSEMIVKVIEADVQSGIFHATNSGQASWFEFAREIFSRAGWDPERIRPTTSDRVPRPAPRPKWSVLGHKVWEERFSWTPRHWREAFSDSWETELSSIVSARNVDG